jgi:hypothetical protein
MLDKRAAVQASGFLMEYSAEKGVYMKVNYFNADQFHESRSAPDHLAEARCE